MRIDFYKYYINFVYGSVVLDPTEQEIDDEISRLNTNLKSDGLVLDIGDRCTVTKNNQVIFSSMDVCDTVQFLDDEGLI